jgi:hypothetical protein
LAWIDEKQTEHLKEINYYAEANNNFKMNIPGLLMPIPNAIVAHIISKYNYN